MDLKNGRFLVVGGAGFIGSHVVESLLKHDVKEIIIYDNFFRGTLENLAPALTDPRVSIFSDGGDILQTDILAKAMEGIDGVFHLAAQWLLHCHEYPRTAFDVNVKGTFNVIEAALSQKVKKVVYSSSASVYGSAVETPMTEEHPLNNETFYGATKICAEHMFKSLDARYGLPWVGLRYMNVYGARQHYKGNFVPVIMKILDRVEEGLSPILFGDGSQEFDFISVNDVAESNVCAMRSNATGASYNVGTGIGISLKDLAHTVMKLCGTEKEIEYHPASQVFVNKRIGSTVAAERDLGFKAMTTLEDGIRDLIAWRRQQEAKKA
jgi:UDP-glucose 4-epimerase